MSLVAVRHYATSDAARLQAVRDCWTESERLARRQAALAKWREVEQLFARSDLRSRNANCA
jgi:hypothetical protein